MNEEQQGQQPQGELFKVEKEILIKQLEGGIISLTVDGQREIPADIAAAQHRVGEILGLEAEKKHTRKNMSYEKAVKEVVRLYSPGSEITTALISKLPGFGEDRSMKLLGKLEVLGLVEDRDGIHYMVKKSD
jgi:hypothetical protein